MATIIIITPPPKKQEAKSANLDGAKYFDTDGLNMDDILSTVKAILEGQEGD